MVDFSRDIRPILSDHCFACHGPDEADRQADVRLDTAEGLSDVVTAGDVKASEMITRILESDADLRMPPPTFHKPLSQDQKDKLIGWVQSGAVYQQHWAFQPISDGTPPSDETSPSTETTRSSGASRRDEGSTVLDSFLNARLRQTDLAVNDEASRATLLRRVALDLTGLPPTPDVTEAFFNDTSPDAYETLVDRLLDSPTYGEHMGRYWLDLVRFADTHGLHLDNYREMWPYRDWVIEAFNANKPFDVFVTEQLAGDLMPDATRDQKIASGFNRLNVTTSEGGSIYDEVFARNVIDRTDAFGTIFLGLTTGCAVCHDHKFDPISSKDYYSLSAYFNSLDGSALDKNAKDPAPVIVVTTPEQDRQLADIDATLNRLRRQKIGEIPTVDQAQAEWERGIIDGAPAITKVLAIRSAKSRAGKTLERRPDGVTALVGEAAATDVITLIAELPPGPAWQTLRLEAIADETTGRVGVSQNGNAVLSEITVDTAERSGGSPDWIPVDIRYGSASYEQAGGDFSIDFAFDGKDDDASAGWAIGGHEKKGDRSAWFQISPIESTGDRPTEIRVQLKFLSKFAAHQFGRVRLSVSSGVPEIPVAQRVRLGDVHSVGPFPVEHPGPGYSRSFASRGKPFDADQDFRYQDRSYRWQLRSDVRQVETNTIDGIKGRTSVTLLHQSIKAPSDQEITMLIDSDDGHVVYLNGKQVGQDKGTAELQPLRHAYKLPLKKGNNRLYLQLVGDRDPQRLTFAYQSPLIATPDHLANLLTRPVDRRTDAERISIRNYFRRVHCVHPDWLVLVMQEKAMVKAKEDLRASFATTLVWKETEQPRQAHVLLRGQYDAPGDPVDRGTPAWLPPFPEDASQDRLGLARWLTAPDHPLTSRVAVNRFWQQLFGTGLVKTSEDFGSQGTPPSHPELLDWLARDFVQSGWNVKRLMKQLVLTDAYRRSASATPHQIRIDPENRLLARGPRFRLDAEVLRDQALALSGLLADFPGGPSVKPPQPSGLWYAVGYTRSNTANFTVDEGADVYRRSVYTFWKRTSPPPQMSTFDAPSREDCTARRERTNTPLQALVMMNEPQYVEAAKTLARRIVRQTEATTDEERIAWLIRHVTMRQPEETEIVELKGLLGDLRNFYTQTPSQAAELAGESSPEQAAWTVVCSTALNLDEVVCK